MRLPLLAHPSSAPSTDPLLQAGLSAFLAGMLGGALATLVVLGPWQLWAGEAVIAPCDTGIEVGGCTLSSEYQAATTEHPYRILVRGSNPGAASAVHEVRVTVLSSTLADSLSRIASVPTPVALSSARLLLPAHADGQVAIPLATALRAGASITVGVGPALMTIRLPRATAVAQAAARPTPVPSQPPLPGEQSQVVAQAARKP